MRRYDKEIKSIKKKFDAKLKELYLQDKESILAFIWFRRIHKTNISKERKQQVITEACKEFNADGLSNNEFIAYLIEKQQKVKNIIDDFKEFLLNQLKERNVTVNHVTRLSPKELNYIIKPNLAETIYNESIGNYVFATLEEKNKLKYAIRSCTGGMFRLGENMVIFPTNNNLEIVHDKLLLRKPVYVYSLDISCFDPVITVRIDSVNKTKNPTIVFDDEWVSTEPILITDKICKKLEDVTDVLEYFKVFMFNDKNLKYNCQESLSIANKTKREIKYTLNEHIKKGNISFINAIVKEKKKDMIKN